VFQYNIEIRGETYTSASVLQFCDGRFDCKPYRPQGIPIRSIGYNRSDTNSNRTAKGS